MISLWCPDLRLAARMRAALGPARPIDAVANWSRLHASAARAECTLYVAPWLAAPECLSRLSSLKLQLPLHPVVLLTTRDAENARLLKDVVVEEVVWLSDFDRTLSQGIHCALGRGFLVRVAAALEASRGLAPALRAALVLACRSPAPIASVVALASHTGYHRRTLWHHWRRMAPPPLARLEDFLDWVCLLRAAASKAPSLSWAHVAERLGMHEHTLTRQARRLMRRRLTELGSGAPQEIADQFTAFLNSQLAVALNEMS
jgi:hypothetical protein